MIELFRSARALQDFIQQEAWRFCFIGGIALQRWGEPRVTQDIDLTLLTGFGNERSYIQRLLEQYPPRIKDAAQFASENRVLLLQSPTGIGIDIALGALPFEENAIARATDFEFLPGLMLLTCSAEDLLVFKAFADRPKDWFDVESVVIRQKNCLEWPYILKELKPLAEAKGASQIISRLEELRRGL